MNTQRMRLVCAVAAGLLSGLQLHAHDGGMPCDHEMMYENSLIAANLAGEGGSAGTTVREAGAETGWTDPAESDRVTLENQWAKVVVWPYAGGAMTEYINKETGTNFVPGTVKAGSSGFGWVDVSHPTPQDPMAEWFSSIPHAYRKVSTPEGEGVEVRAVSRKIESSRLIVLDRKSGKLSVAVRQKNLDSVARRVFPRWHPYIMVGDPFAESSGIFIPDENGNIRQIKVGIGWDDWFLKPRGFAVAGNWKTGEGLWTTFDPRKTFVVTTWTDYRFGKKHLTRGAFTLEPWMAPEMKEPGGSVELTYVYFPFSRKTRAEEFPTDQLPVEAHAEARQFIGLVRPNMEALGTYTMVPEPNTSVEAIKSNRFFFSHRRRDRMALRDWGFSDAMFSAPGVQEKQVRLRLFAKLFEGVSVPRGLEYRFQVQDAAGRTVIDERTPVELTKEAPVADIRREVSIRALPDGLYQLSLEVFEKGSQQPIHTYAESRNLVGQRRAELVKKPRAGVVVTPFVEALMDANFETDPKNLSVPVGVEDGSGQGRRAWPVTTSVPFAKGVVRADTRLRLVSPQGKEVAFDSKPAGTWDDGSLRWLTIDFPADIPAGGHAFYRLMAGAPTVNTPGTLLKDDGKAITFDNGQTQWRWDRSGGALGPLKGHDLWWSSADGTQYRFELRGPGAGLEIEQNGSQRAVVRATGWYYAQGKDAPIARAQIRFEGYRGQAFMRVYHNAMYAGTPWNDGIGSFGAKVLLPGNTASARALLDGKTVDLSNSFTLYQKNADAYALENQGTVTQGKRASGVFQVTNTSGVTRTLVLCDLWRMNPKQVSIQDADQGRKAMVFDYWPARAGVQGFMPEEDKWLPSSSSPESLAQGMSRTHELIVCDAPLGSMEAVDRLFSEPVAALTPPRYLARTGAMMHLAPFDPKGQPEVEAAISQTLDSYMLNQELWGWYGLWSYGAMPNMFLQDEYRWADFGRYAHILNEEDIVQTPWLAYMRSGDRKYLKFALANTRQIMEVSTIAWGGLWPEFEGLSRRHHQCPWLSGGDYGHSMLDPFLEMYRMTGYRPAWDAAVKMADAMKLQGEGTWRYLANPLAGLSRMYLETQDPAYLQHANRIWNDLCYPDKSGWWRIDHGDRAVMYYSQINPQCAKLWEDWAASNPERLAGWDVRAKLFLASGNPDRASEVYQQVTAFLQKSARTSAAKNDPLMLNVNTITQHVLVSVRQLCYVGQVMDAGKEAAAKPGAKRAPVLKDQNIDD